MDDKQLTEEERLAAAKRGYEDPVWFCRTFLPHLFSKPIPWMHRAILAILLGRAGFLKQYGELDKILENFPTLFRRTTDGGLRLVRRRYVLIMIPRGFSKTTLAGIAVPIMKVVYHDINFGVYISETGPHAKMQLDNVKNELATNDALLAVFGPQRPSVADDQRWAGDFFETTTGAAFAARGRGAQIRGLNHKGVRPKLVILDDLEDEESIATQEQREKTRRWFFGAVKPALSRLDPESSIVYLCTLQHEDALPCHLMTDKQWSVVKLGANLPDGSPLWPEMMTTAAIEEEKEVYANAGMLRQFYLEYFNDARPEEAAKFRRDFFRYGPLEGKIVGTSLYCDPAISKAKYADDTVLAVVSICDNGRHYVRDMWGKRGADERVTVDKYFELARIYQPTRFGFEANGFQAAIMHLIQEEMYRKNHFFVIEPVKNVNRKAERILGILQPRYANGYIWHCAPFSKLETQLLDYRPEVEVKDDWPDALAGAIALLTPYAAAAAEVDPEDEDEFEDLDDLWKGQETWYH